MYLTYLRIERFKCFEDITLRFGKLTLLAGNNGVGKSSAIQTLLLLRQAAESGDLQKNSLPLNGQMTRIGTAKDALLADADEDCIAFTLGLSQTPETKYHWIFNCPHPQNQYILQGQSEHQHFPDSALFAPKFTYLMAERVGPRIRYPMSDLSNDTLHVGYQGEYTAECLAKCGDNAVIFPKLVPGSVEHTETTLAYRTRLWMQELLPNISFDAQALSKVDMATLGMRVQTTDYLRPTNMGFGVSYTLPIVVAGLMAEPGTMLIVENPESHLHPAAQSKIAQFLARIAACGVQVVIETHSDHILNGIRIAVKQQKLQGYDPKTANSDVEILFFRQDNTTKTAVIERPQVYPDGGISEWPKVFFDQLEQDLEELI